MFTDIAGEMAEAKCRFIGSATLAENIDTVAVPPGVAPILGETRDPYLRETLRDMGCAQAFRRDVYRKGVSPMPAPEQQATMEALTPGRAGPAGSRRWRHVRHADRQRDRAPGGLSADA